MSLTHRGICLRVAEWLLRTAPWCDVAAYEIGGPGVVTDTSPVPPPPEGSWYEENPAAWRIRHEKHRGTVLDVLALTSPGGRAKGRPRVQIVEVKRTVSDLRADLRARKMLGYETLPGVTDVLLAGPDEVLAEAPGLGLPPSWGLISVSPGSLRVVRKSRPINECTEAHRADWTARVARAFGWRMCRAEGTS